MNTSMNKKPIRAFLFLLYAHLCFAQVLTKNEIESKLSVLKPLPKVHYSWGWPAELLEDPNNKLTYQTARILNSVSISGPWVTMKQMRTAVYTCARINKTNPEISLSIGINYSPFHRELEPNVPPTYRGPSYQKELEMFKSRMETLKEWIKKDNSFYKSDVKVGAVLLDMERFHARSGDEKWNEGMRDALDTIHNIALSIFPEARIEWYGRGMRWVRDDPPWRRTPYFTGKEKLSSLSCSLYTIAEIEKTLERYRRTVNLADELKVEDVTPWVSLAAGYRRGILKVNYELDWDYDIIYSYMMGRYINIPWYGVAERADRFAPFNRAKLVVFYPPPFDPRTPHWGKHFIAYVRGANDIKDLKDLGYSGE